MLHKILFIPVRFNIDQTDIGAMISQESIATYIADSKLFKSKFISIIIFLFLILSILSYDFYNNYIKEYPIIKRDTYYLVVGSFKKEINANNYKIKIKNKFKINPICKNINDYYRIIIDSTQNHIYTQRYKIIYSLYLETKEIIIIKK